MDPHDFLDVAGDWVVAPREVEWRSAVSRAYYAAFHVARLLFHRCRFVVPLGAQVHDYLARRLANSGHPDVQLAGNDLRFLRRRRNEADYDLNKPLAQQDAANYVASAVDVIRLLDSLPSLPHLLAQITATMRVYERDVLGEVTWRP